MGDLVDGDINKELNQLVHTISRRHLGFRRDRLVFGGNGCKKYD